MNVLILTEGGRDIGLGHITRCTSVYEAFEEFGVQSQLIVNGDDAVGELLTDKNTRVFNWLSGRESLLAAIENADIVFIDSYKADEDLYETVSSTAKTAVYLDDTMRINYPKGFVLNGAVLAEQMPYPEREGVTYLLGARYAPLRREFWNVPAKPIHDKLGAIMITFGGSDMHGLTAEVLKLLVDTYPNLVKKVIVAKGFRNIADIESLKDDKTELVYYPDAAGMKEVMLESDVAISAGGQTLYELARVGVPAIVVIVADNQSHSVRGWEKVGFAEYAGQWDDDGVIGAIAAKIELLKSRSLRESKRKVGRNVIDGAGISRVVRELLSAFYRPRLTLRRATLADARDLFDLANDEVVRRNSFEAGPIEWDHHLQWLTGKLGDSKCFFFVVDYQGRFAGQVRFDAIPEREEAEISISLQEYIRGLGLAPFIISRSIEELLRTGHEVTVVKAHIKDGNLASVKAFQGAGFTFSKRMQIKGCESRVYEKAAEDGRT
jgi:spore coat polysaccharide biosynthesis predicted glycosyltransferase SpsG/RimJ/RimL family protein N-acetyltransferase